ncbi:MAG TPA: hypothetical protein VF942_01630 [Acidimicrobiales bacterium]
MSKESAGDPGSKPPGRPPSDPEGPFPFGFFGIGLVIGLYAMLPAFAGPQLHVQRITEVVDHVIPGLIVLTLVASGILLGARPAGIMLAFGAFVTLAGLWMVDTHIGLLRQAADHEVDLVAAGFHVSTALAVFVFGLAFVWRYREMLTGSRA